MTGRNGREAHGRGVSVAREACLAGLATAAIVLAAGPLSVQALAGNVETEDSSDGRVAAEPEAYAVVSLPEQSGSHPGWFDCGVEASIRLSGSLDLSGCLVELDGVLHDLRDDGAGGFVVEPPIALGEGTHDLSQLLLVDSSGTCVDMEISSDDPEVPLLVEVDSVDPVAWVSVEGEPALVRDGVAYFTEETSVDLLVRDDSFDPSETLVGDAVVPWEEDGDVWSHRIELEDGDTASLPAVVAVDMAGNSVELLPLVSGVATVAVDASGPSASALVEAPASGELGDWSYVFYDGLSGDPGLRLSVDDATGIDSVSIVDPSGRYAAKAQTVGGARRLDLEEILLAEGVPWDGSVELVATDVLGNVSRWSVDSAAGVRVTGEDGISSDVRPLLLLLDRSAPRIQITGIEEGATYSESQTLTLSIEDDAIGYLVEERPETPVLWVTREGSGGVVREVVTLGDLQRDTSRSYSITLELGEDGSYEVASALTDPAGNSASIVVGGVVVDQTPPEVWVSLGREDFSGDTYSNHAVVATVHVRDATFSEGLVDLQTTGVVGQWSANGDLHEVDVRFGEGEHRLSLLARDLAGNGPSAAEVSPFVVDLTPPVLGDIALDATPAAVYGDNVCYFSSPVTAALEVVDACGVEWVGARLSAASFSLEGASGDLARTARLRLGDGGRLGPGDEVSAADVAGNLSSSPALALGLVDSDGRRLRASELVVDSTSPSVFLAGAEAGSITSSDVVLAVSAYDENMGDMRRHLGSQECLVVWRSPLEGGERTVTRSLSLNGLEWDGLGAVSGSVVLDDDGRYAAEAVFRDPAGNVSVASLGEFSVDQTPPEISISLEEGERFSHEVRAVVSVVEPDFDPSLIEVETTGVMGSWVGSGEVHTVEVTFSSDGEHRLAVGGSDTAGNVAARREVAPFVVDQTAPTVRVLGVEDGGAYPGVLTPVVEILDETGFDGSLCEVILASASRGEVEILAAPLVTPTGMTLEVGDLPHEEAWDDVYSLRVTAADLSGNITTESVTFSVNRFGSTFCVIDQFGEMVPGGDLGCLGEAGDVRILEVNPSGSDEGDRWASVTRGAETLWVRDFGDDLCSLHRIDDDRGWDAVVYEVSRKAFSRDGVYEVAVGSRDRAGNDNESARGATARLVLDTTAPVISAVDVYAEEETRVEFSVTDNLGLDAVNVLTPSGEFVASALGDGRYLAVVEGRPSQVTLQAKDLAGNVAEKRVEDGGAMVSGEAREGAVRMTAVLAAMLVTVLLGITIGRNRDRISSLVT